ncbi:S1 family peptidase [Streptomyces capparidis]
MSARTRRSRLAALAASALLAGAAAGAGSAAAAPTPTEEADAGRIASVEALLGPRSTAGFYRESSGRMVVNVTDGAAAEQVRAAGAVPRMVRHSSAELAGATAALEKSARVPGTAWAVDPRSNQVVVHVDESVEGRRLAALNGVVSELGDKARMERVDGRLSLFLAGGEAMYSGNTRCSAGVNVRTAERWFTVTAGHCTTGRAQWFADTMGQAPIGTTVGSSFPGNDFGIVERTNTWLPRPGAISLHNGYVQDVRTAGEVFVGQPVQRSGSTTGVRGGFVRALNVTVNYPQGTVSGLVGTTACAEPGDSGGPFFSGSTVLGLTSGGSGNCTLGGMTFYQPITEVLSAYGVAVY